MPRAARAVITLVLLTGCAHTPEGGELRVPENVPSNFVTEDGEPAVGECRSPMIDPRDQTRVRLVRSSAQGTLYRGDYEVPIGRYGMREGELLRLNCETGQVIGIVSN